MKRMIFILLILLAANSAFAQQFRATSFEFEKTKELLSSGEDNENLFITVDGKKRKIAAKAILAWIISGGKEVVYSASDGSGGLENVGQSLRLYNVKNKTTKKIMSEYFHIVGLTEITTKTGKRLLLIKGDDGMSGQLHFAVVDPQRGEIFRRQPGALIAVKGNFITLAIDEDSEDEDDDGNKTAFIRIGKPKNFKTYDLRKLLKRKVIYNPRSQ